MICIWLLESRECASAKEALDKFGDRRTNWDKGNVFQGVETPSQSRFVGYYDIITNKLGGLLPAIRVLKLSKVIIHSMRGIGNNDGSDFSMIVYNIDKTVAVSCNFSNEFNCKVCLNRILKLFLISRFLRLKICFFFQYSYSSEKNQVLIDKINSPPLKEEVKIMFYSSNKNVPKYYDECAFFFTFHTSFIDSGTNRLFIPRNELDNPHKEKFWNVYNSQFAVELLFDPVNV
jgi:PTEN phosphatase family protein